MMKTGSSIVLIRWQMTLFSIMVIACVLAGPGYSQTDEVALLITRGAGGGGKISPDPGVHYYPLNSYLTITAVPEAGYNFVYWIGDVANPTANKTTVYLDSPKIIIAVFEQSEYEFLVAEELGASASGGRGGMRRSAGDYARSGGGGIGVRRPVKWTWPAKRLPKGSPFTPYESPEDDDFSVPQAGDPLPVPVPEPATAVLLVGGACWAFTRRRTKRKR